MLDMIRGWVIQCSCMSLISVSWKLLKSHWDKFDSDCILCQGDQLFKYIGKFRSLEVEDLPQNFLIANSSINMEFLENKTGEITARVYLVSIAEIVYIVQQIGTGTLLIINSYILGLIWETILPYLFD